MLTRKIHTPAAPIDFAALRSELGIPAEFPRPVLAEASQLTGGDAPGIASWERADDRDIPFVTVDPAGSRDLDQALHLETTDDGFRVRYAIADVAAFVAPGGALDDESRRRGATLYSPDIRTPLYPQMLSEGAASLLPEADRPAVMWTIDLDDRGEPIGVDVRRSTVRSRAQLDYDGVQDDANVGRLHPSIALLPRVGRLRLQAARRRHAINLDLPDSEVVPDGHGRWTLRRRATLPMEKYNAQISLLTGMCAAQIMMRARVGILRTLPPPTAHQVAQLRRATAMFGIPWPDDVPPGDVVSELDASRPRQAAFIEDAIRLLRGAGYTAFDGQPPRQEKHGGLGAAYAHVTAPLRRLVDRFASEVCLAACANTEIPQWARQSLDGLPATMESAHRRAGQLDRACVAAVSEFLLANRVGDVLTGMAVQVDRRRDRATVLLDEPPVRIHMAADNITEGTRIAVRLTRVEPSEHLIETALVS